jgi:hypothetical protein
MHLILEALWILQFFRSLNPKIDSVSKNPPLFICFLDGIKIVLLESLKKFFIDPMFRNIALDSGIVYESVRSANAVQKYILVSLFPVVC